MPEPDEFTRKQSAEAIRLYTVYRHELDHTEIGGRFMPYRWWTLPDPLDVIWMPYSGMLSEYASELVDSNEAGHAFRTDAGHLFQFHSGHRSDLKPAAFGV